MEAVSGSQLRVHCYVTVIGRLFLVHPAPRPFVSQVNYGVGPARAPEMLVTCERVQIVLLLREPVRALFQLPSCIRAIDVIAGLLRLIEVLPPERGVHVITLQSVFMFQQCAAG